jgi:hypothetical protein
MLTITESAWNRLAKIQSTRPQIVDFRLTYLDGKVKCKRGVLKTHDKVIEQQGHPKLLLSRKVARKLDQRTLDTIEATNGLRLELT